MITESYTSKNRSRISPAYLCDLLFPLRKAKSPASRKFSTMLMITIISLVTISVAVVLYVMNGSLNKRVEDEFRKKLQAEKGQIELLIKNRLDEIDNLIYTRMTLSEKYNELLSDNMGLQQWSQNSSRNFGYYPVLFSSEEVVIKVKHALEKDSVFARRYFFPSLDDVEAIAQKRQGLVISSDISRRILCLPLYPSLNIEDVVNISKIINKVIND